MSIAITGATGGLGRLVVESLLARGVSAGEIVAGGRNVAAIADLADRGVDVRRIDFDDADTVAAGLAGADRVLLVSGTDFGRRVEQHVAVARAAKAAGATGLVYTSAPRALTTSMLLAADHGATERALTEIDLPLTVLRNGWYFENYTSQLPTYLEHGSVVTAAGDGRVSAAPRADYADAAAVVLTEDGHAGKVYELGGDMAFGFGELAAAVSAATGRDIALVDVSVAELTAILVGAGVPEPLAAIFADVDRAISVGELEVDSGDLSRLIGRPTGSLADALAAAVAAG